MTIRWECCEDPPAQQAFIDRLSIGAVFRTKYSENWYGYVEGHGRIGSCPDEAAAKAAVERIWNKATGEAA